MKQFEHKITFFASEPAKKYPHLWNNGWCVCVKRFLGVRYLYWLK